jgi:GntR family transcriptional regulator
MAEYDTSRGTVREAIALLRAEGLVVTQRGRGTYVRPILPVLRQSSERYRSEANSPLSTSFTHDEGIPWSAYQLDRTFTELPADQATADLFGLPPGTMLLHREFVFRSHGLARQMSTSSYPLDLVAGTPVADPDREPWPGGNLAQLLTLGVIVTGIREVVRSRMPAGDESDVLGIPSGVPVSTITRQTYAGDRVVEVAMIVIPGDRVELEYWIPLP